LSYSATGLPPGLTINSNSGVVSGTPTVSGEYRLTVRVDDGHASAEVTFEWSVVALSPSLTNESASSGGGGLGPIWLIGLLLVTLRVLTGSGHIGRRQALEGTLMNADPSLRANRTNLSLNKRLAAGIMLLLLTIFHQETSFGSETPTLPSYDRVRVLQSPPHISDKQLIDQDGRPFRFSQLRGRVSLIFFGFTNCADVCPMALQKLRQLEEHLEPDSGEIAYVMISVDGDRDTPEVMKRYLERYSPRFKGATGQIGDMKALASEFSAAFFKGSAVDKTGGYSVSHSPQVFLVDQESRLRAEFYNASIEAMNSTVQALLAEARVSVSTDSSGQN